MKGGIMDVLAQCSIRAIVRFHAILRLRLCVATLCLTRRPITMIFRSLLFVPAFCLFTNILSAADSPFSETAVDFAQWVPTTAPDDTLSREARRNSSVTAAWAAAAFGSKKVSELTPSSIRVMVERQDYGTLGMGHSSINTPIVIGSQRYKHGLGTHSTSILRFSLPVEATKFDAEIGIDNNDDTQGKHGSVTFAVEVGGKELYRSEICKGGDEPVGVSLDLPAETRELVLKVDDGGDGPSHDQADWADAKITTATGEVLYLDDVKIPFVGEGIPFSFQYGGVHSSELLPHWTFSEKSQKLPDRTQAEYRWLDPKTGLAVTAVVETLDQYPAVDWLLYFENTGDKETPLLENVAAADVGFLTSDRQNPVRIHTLTGDQCDKYSWHTAKHDIFPHGSKTFQPHGGRSSNGAFPFWNLQVGDSDFQSNGVFISLGWSGQWKATFQRDDKGRTKFSAGMERLATVLVPGEKIRSPRILLMQWDGDRQRSHVLFRRLLMYHYIPKRPDGRPVRLPIAAQTFDRYFHPQAGRPTWGTFAGQVDYLNVVHRAGCDTLWYDAGWFFPLEGQWWTGVGNWFNADPTRFPNGLKPLANLVHERNMRFILWFEPERVAKGSRMTDEYSQYIFGGKEGGLFKLNDLEAREFITQLIGDRVEDFGLDVLRVDFNIDPLSFWRNNDSPNRQGMTEIRYVEGHYAMWDVILERFPELWIDNCASGGRRIDLETLKRSVPLWRSDTCCSPNNENLDQNQQVGLMHYLPLFTGSAWESDPYIARSSASMGLIAHYGFLDADYQEQQAQDSILEARINQKIWYGDFYPMTETDAELRGWTAYQVHRADLDAGIAVFFRRDLSPYPAFQASLRSIDSDADYQVELRPNYTDTKVLRMKGVELKGYEVRLPEKRSSLMLRYWKN